MDSQKHLEIISGFLSEIGIDCRAGEIPEETLLPGIHIEAGAIFYDPGRLLHPGDLLHEAGHIATMPPSERDRMTGNLESTPGDEMAAIAWSFAAVTHLGLDPGVVFHANGYQEGADSLLASFSGEQPVGTPLLAWYGMTDLPGFDDASEEVRFPRMRSWLREEKDSNAENRGPA